MTARIKTGHGQLVPALLRLVIDHRHVAHLPDEVVGSLGTKPRLQHISDAEALILTSEEAPRALQLSPEHHKAFLGVFDFDHFDHFDLDIFQYRDCSHSAIDASIIALA